jgi:hypothetical protein
MGILPDELKRLKEIKEMGYFRFVAIFTWTYQEDDMASKRLLQWSKDGFTKVGIDWKTTRGYLLTGARTVIVIGHAASPAALQAFSSLITMNTAIQATYYHALETNELPEVGSYISRVLGTKTEVGKPFKMSRGKE